LRLRFILRSALSKPQTAKKEQPQMKTATKPKVLLNKRNDPEALNILAEWNGGFEGKDKRRKSKYVDFYISWDPDNSDMFPDTLEIESDIDAAIKRVNEIAACHKDGFIDVTIECGYSKWVPGHWQTESGCPNDPHKMWIQGCWEHDRYENTLVVYQVECCGQQE
jgi:hypothetical protein